MSDERGSVSVIIPTLGRRERGDLLEEALSSIRCQAGVRALPIVVLNGTRAGPDVERRLREREDVRLLLQDSADLPSALAAGRRSVDAPYFTVLDDDDVLLPGALERRIAALEAEPELDVVVTNGLLRSRRGEERHLVDEAAIRRDPLRALLEGNWLLQGSWLARSDRVGPDLFRGIPRYLECTFLAVRFASSFRMRWLGEATVVHRTDSPLAESLSPGYVLGQPAALRRILALDLPPDVRRAFERRLADACHDASDLERMEGRLREAWRWHLASLAKRGGWRYLPYTRHLCSAAAGSGAASPAGGTGRERGEE